MKIISWLGVTTVQGIVLKGRRIRKVENHWTTGKRLLVAQKQMPQLLFHVSREEVASMLRVFCGLEGGYKAVENSHSKSFDTETKAM